GVENAAALHDRPEAGGVVAVQHQRRDAEVPRRLVRGIVPALAARLSLERREMRPVLAGVVALEDAGVLDAHEHALGRGGEGRDLRKVLAVLAVRDALAGERPGLP